MWEKPPQLPGPGWRTAVSKEYRRTNPTEINKEPGVRGVKGSTNPPSLSESEDIEERDSNKLVTKDTKCRN
jgi:hypothetical protein